MIERSGYRAVLFSSDGTWVTDYPRKTLDEVRDALNNQGSRWYFYPFHAVISDDPRVPTSERKRLVDVAPPFDMCLGMTIKEFGALIAECDEAFLQEVISS